MKVDPEPASSVSSQRAESVRGKLLSLAEELDQRAEAHNLMWPWQMADDLRKLAALNDGDE